MRSVSTALPTPKRRLKGDQQASARRGFLVALGASAGGLQALGNLLRRLPSSFAAPIVVVLHLDPSHVSHLANLLQRETLLRVQVAKSGAKLLPGSVYVAPPDRHLEIDGARITLTRTARVRFSRPSIDRLFASVAQSYGDRAVGVILSGTGSDGSRGIASMHSEGGLVIAQDPKTAEFSAMPANAVATGLVDVILPVPAIPAVLMRAVGHDPSDTLPPEWPVLVALLRKRFGTDFGGYRTTTLNRRLDRRMLATQKPNLKAYLELLRKDEAELKRLHSELLIKVSSFFRDPKEWKDLVSKVVRPMARRPSTKKEFRIWCAGCATGEEAYSLAIVFSETLAETRHQGRFKVFATDLDEGALTTARGGAYREAQLTGLSTERLRRHFDRDGDTWRVKKDLRKHLIFGKHDLLNDPPLASIDLLSCRNVLIYFTPTQAKAVLQRLARSLNPEGYLFLGHSEGLHKADTGLERVAAATRIFRRRPSRSAVDLSARRASRSKRELGGALRKPIAGMPNRLALRDLVLETAAVLMFGVDSARRIVLWNRAAAVFFDTSARDALGKPIAEVVGPLLWDGLRASVEEAAGHRSVRKIRLAYGAAGAPRHDLDVDWIRFSNGGTSTQGLLFLAVEAGPQAKSASRRADGGPGPATSDTEELETLNEELQSTSEEQQTLNEELESRNEELQTVNEELQSLNEELNTLNEEVGVRIAEADRLAGFLRTILDLAPTAVVGCDLQNRVTFWNSVATKQFMLSEAQAIGRDLFELVPVLDVPAVHNLVRTGGVNRSVVVKNAPGHPGSFRISLGAVRDRGGRRQGFCLRIGVEKGEDANEAGPRAIAKRHSDGRRE